MWRKIGLSLLLWGLLIAVYGVTSGSARTLEPLLPEEITLIPATLGEGKFSSTLPDPKVPRFLVTPQWQQLSPNPDPVHGSPPARYNHSMEYSAANHTLYLFGGQGAAYLNDVWSLNLNTLTWQKLFTDSSSTTNIDYPVRRRTAVMSVDNSAQNLYLATGQRSNGTNYNDIWRFNLASRSWQKLCTQTPCTNSVPEIRYGAAGAKVGGDLLVSHGFDSGRHDDTWRFDLSSGTWDKISPNSNLPIGRCLLDGAAVGNKFIIHGGQSNSDTYRADTWIFNLTSETWTEVAIGGVEGVDIPDGRHHQSLVEYSDENGVLLFGGLAPSNTHFNDAWFLDLDSNTWQELSPTGTKPSGRRSHAAVWVEAGSGRPAGMLLVGGRNSSGSALADLWLLGFPTPPTGNPGSLQFTGSDYSVAETGIQATITVTRSGGVSGTVTVQYETSDGTATAGQNYTATSGTLTFNNGEAGPKSFNVPVIVQPAADGNKTVNLTLKNPGGGATLGSPNSAVLTILDTNKAGLLHYTLSNYGAAETDSQATISVTRSEGMSGTVTVAYQAGGGTAIIGQDYTPVSGTLTFNHGEVGPKTFNIPLADDNLVDGDKTVALSLAAPTGGAALGTPSAATLTLFDSDAAGLLQFTLSQFQVSESVPQAIINVNRSGGVSGTVTVDYEASGGTAGVGSEYTPVSGTLTFNSGEAGPKSFSVPLSDDTLIDGNKTVNLVLKNPGGGAALGSPDNATLLIVDNDSAGQLLFTQSQFQAGEGDGNAIIRVVRSGGASGLVTVKYQASGGTASIGSDYTPVSGTLTFNNGEPGPKTFTVPLFEDVVADGHKTVNLTLQNPSGGATLGSPSTATLTIFDTKAAGQIRFSAAGYTVGEGGNALINVTRTLGFSGTVTVQYETANNSATAGQDYTATSGSLTFNHGEAGPKSFNVPTLDDDIDEGNEAVTLRLKNPGGGAVLGSPNVANLVITDDDPSGGFSMSLYLPAIIKLSEDPPGEHDADLFGDILK